MSDCCQTLTVLMTCYLSGSDLLPEMSQDQTPRHCFQCDKDFSTAEKLQQHQRLHQRALQLVCDICGRGFSRASNLKEHLRSHTGERPFQCDVCKKRFSTQRVFKKHQEIHSRRERSVTTATGDGPDQQVRTSVSYDAESTSSF